MIVESGSRLCRGLCLSAGAGTLRLTTLALALALASPAGAEGLAEGTRVALIGASADDPRFAPAGEAMAFWNGVFDELGIPPRFADPTTRAAPAALRDFENHARRLSQQAGRAREGTRVADGPPPPASLLAVDADIVVLLSAQRIKPFSWPLDDDGRFFICLPASLSDDPTGVRAVLAHELGHALGLSHRDDRSTLMCHPCLTPTRATAGAGFPALHPDDRHRLRQIYGSSAPATPGATP